ncbi:MAG: bifunctional (p)ppGpp synthetase/guanosine-3',5'-bis(diphosphate) 3'-pyrophosphohydrolase [Candidatus Latescibacteria bacterium]|nr:bifunctional (p)ppGpp synthetase/guanosine-3',5'-bis(diphosphate) 3'-pyrophosphohydrolase [Candidatus Latescibacterota bacterium]
MHAIPKERKEAEQADATFERLRGEIQAYNETADLDRIERAYRLSALAHRGQVRKSGLPFVHHGLEVARILAGLHLDSMTLAAGLLHDVVEDTQVPLSQIRNEFGEALALLVDGVTKISELKLQSREIQQAEYFRKMLLSMAKDIRVILVKLADRLDNMRSLQYLAPEKQQRIALETREVYAPLAHRFGIARIKMELEDLSLKALDPEAYEEIKAKVALSLEERERQIDRIRIPLAQELRAHDIEAEISGRAKHFYSIYTKMQHRGKSFEEIYDLMAIRIIVPTVPDCYHALGWVHALFTPVADRFKDFIATPKSNMYQSVHTTVIVPRGQRIEIQIRTPEMHRIAEVGIAAHWRYKEGRTGPDELDHHLGWIRDMVERQHDAMDAEEFMEDLKIELYQDEIFVFTPKGDLKHLPRGATALDFAFSVHTDIGLHCFGTKVNGRMVPIGTPLRSGDSVEILTSPNQKPTPDWLHIVQSSKARSRIKRYLKAESFWDSVRLGREMLGRKLSAREADLLALARKHKLQDTEHLFAAIGSGEIPLSRVTVALSGEKQKPQRRLLRRKGVRAVRIQGMGNMMIRFAECCRPVPGDEITGFVTRGRGVSVHRQDCPNIATMLTDEKRRIEVEWDSGRGNVFVARILVHAVDRRDLLNDITRVIRRMRINIRTSASSVEIDRSVVRFELEVQDLQQLRKLMAEIEAIDSVLTVERPDEVEEPPRRWSIKSRLGRKRKERRAVTRAGGSYSEASA